MKKILAILVVACMMLGAMPAMVVNAATNYTEFFPVASVNDWLEGTVIHNIASPPAGNPIENAFNGTVAYVYGGDYNGNYTEVVGIVAGSSWVGLDFGKPMKIDTIAYQLRRDGATQFWSGRFVGVFQGADNPAFTDAVDLWTIAAPSPAPTTEALYTESVDCTYQYVRFLIGNVGGVFNVANIMFFGTDAENDDAVTGVTVSPSTATIDLGGTVQLGAAIEPSTAGNKKVTWESSNTAVATVGAYGLVTGVGAGTAVITATTEDGEFEDSCTVTVVNRFLLKKDVHGTVMGSGNVYLNSTGDAAVNLAGYTKAFDGNYTNNTNVFDGATDKWVGLELDDSYQIVLIRFWACPGWESRSANGIFQGADNADFTDPTTLYTISGTPAAGMNEYAVTETAGFKYVRFISASGQMCDIAEVEFYTSGIVASSSPTITFEADDSVTVDGLTGSATLIVAAYSSGTPKQLVDVYSATVTDGNIDDADLLAVVANTNVKAMLFDGVTAVPLIVAVTKQ